jgi:AraC-like DNA-binding protein
MSKVRVALRKRLRNMRAMKTLPANFVDSRDFARIGRAIAFINENFRSQPRLEAVAASAGLSEFHFNRLFRRWAGITPKQYLTFVTGSAARAELESDSSVLDAALNVGLSGPGRLHDLVLTLEAMTPGELKAQGQGTGELAPAPRRRGHELSAQGVAGARRARRTRAHDLWRYRPLDRLA